MFAATFWAVLLAGVILLTLREALRLLLPRPGPRPFSTVHPLWHKRKPTPEPPKVPEVAGASPDKPGEEDDSTKKRRLAEGGFFR